MALDSIIPAPGSVISRGAIITVAWDNANLPNIYLYKSGTKEVVASPAQPTYSFGTAYTGSLTPNGGGFDIAFNRNAGWPDSDFVIVVYDGWTEVETQSAYTILAEGQYPPDMQPFTDPAEGDGSGGTDISVEDEGSELTAGATKFNFVGTGVDATAPVANEVTVTIPGAAASAIAVEDEGLPITSGVVKFDFVGDGVDAADPASSAEVTVTIPGNTPIVVEDEGLVVTSDVAKIDFTGCGDSPIVQLTQEHAW